MCPDFYDGPPLETVAVRLISWAAEEGRMKWPDARRVVAREAGIAPGSLERLEAGRLKFKDRIAGPVHALLVRTIERKIKALEHELIIARRLGARARGIDLDAVEAALAKARKLLGKD